VEQVTSESVRSRDGTKISYQIYGRGRKTIVFVPGLAVPNLAYSPLMSALGDYKFITWHSRGTYQSDRPTRRNFLVEDHVADLEAIVKKEKLSDFCLAGWSLGVQTILCFSHRHPEITKSMILLNGSFKGLIDCRIGHLSPTVNLGLKIAKPLGKIIDPSTRWLARKDLRYLKPLLKYSRLSKNPDDFFMNVLKEFVAQPMDVMIETIRGAEEFSAEHLLPQIQTPAFISSGTHDPFVPIRLCRDLAKRLVNSELYEIDGGTHYTLIEQPNLIIPPIKRFLETTFSR